jgi:hypothetical protein
MQLGASLCWLLLMNRLYRVFHGIALFLDDFVEKAALVVALLLGHQAERAGLLRLEKTRPFDGLQDHDSHVESLLQALHRVLCCHGSNLPPFTPECTKKIAAPEVTQDALWMTVVW